MTSAVTRPVDPAHAFDVERVGAWLRQEVGPYDGPLEVVQFSGGQSSPTFLLTSSAGRYVLRRKPAGPTLRTAHAVDREFRVTRALHAAGFPVARPLALCDDPSVIGTPFFVMDHVDGIVHWDPRLPLVPPGGRRVMYAEMASVLARLHAIDIDGAGLGDFGRREGYFARQVARWSEQYLASRTRDLPAMDALVDWLRDHQPRESGRSAILHGDFRLDNLIFDRDAPVVRAVIDWELSTLGDPLADLSYQCMVWHLPAGAFGSLRGVDLAREGLPDEAEYLAMYAERTGLRRPDDWNVAIVYNLFRLAAILEGVARRAIDGNASSTRAAEMGRLVAPIADTAWALARSL
ncbi:MAG: phosphotransferase [Gemmatimonadetes bacterium]|nr:phosphotransferase [Gemmatimonadota bacterium]